MTKCKKHLNPKMFLFLSRNKLSTWISKCAEQTYAKSGGTATKLRDEGNAKFRLHDNDGSIRLDFFVKSTLSSILTKVFLDCTQKA